MSTPDLDKVAAELMAAVLACEDALDAMAYEGGPPYSGTTRDRTQAARAHIAHARDIAQAAGVFRPAVPLIRDGSRP